MSNLIDVIVPVYNDADGLQRCLTSLEDQYLSTEYFRVVVVDDGSRDNPERVVKSHDKLNAMFIRHEANLGLPSALNSALDASHARYFVRVDADDYVHAGFLQALLWVFENNPEITGVASDYKRVDLLENVISYHSARDNPIGCGIMFRRVVLDVIGKYDPDFKLAEEVDFIMRYHKHFKLDYLGICLYRYTQKEGTLTSQKGLYRDYITRAKLKNKGHGHE